MGIYFCCLLHSYHHFYQHRFSGLQKNHYQKSPWQSLPTLHPKGGRLEHRALLPGPAGHSGVRPGSVLSFIPQPAETGVTVPTCSISSQRGEKTHRSGLRKPDVTPAFRRTGTPVTDSQAGTPGLPSPLHCPRLLSSPRAEDETFPCICNLPRERYTGPCVNP